MTQQTEALNVALDALRNSQDYKMGRAITVEAVELIEESLAQPEQKPVAWLDVQGNGIPVPVYTNPPTPKEPEQEPVAWATRMGEYAHIHWGAKRPEYPMVYEAPLYTTPPQRTWVGLSVFEINELVENTEYEDYCDLVERTETKLRSQNEY